ncbi:MAG: hypothetical protein ACE5GE_08215 [Phycisphaerae bacterium]
MNDGQGRWLRWARAALWVVPLVGVSGRWVGLCLLMGLAGGCQSGGSGGSGRSGSSVSSEGEPNDSFAQAGKVAFNSAKSASILGTIDNPGDLDVYDLGPMVRGNRIVVSVDSLTSGFDFSIALFDGDFKLFMDNDDRDLDARRLDPFVDQVVRHEGVNYYLVVGQSAFAGVGPTQGDYRADVEITSGQTVPPTKRQPIFPNFDGGEVEPDNLLVKNVRAFDASAISVIYAGQDDIIIQSIVDTMRENFDRFDVEIITDPADLPADGQYMTIMFGSRSARAFGISETVDHYNSVQNDTAIIFTESFTPLQFQPPRPDAAELGVAIGNIASHEAGHLLGLNHVDDTAALMDAVSPADTFLEDQNFMDAPLSGDILPIGTQDSALLLSESVGLLPGVILQRGGPIAWPATRRYKFMAGASWCGTCNRKLLGR